MVASASPNVDGTEVPAGIQEKHAKLWWVFGVALLVLVLLDVVAADGVAALVTLVLAAMVWAQVRNRFAQMSPQYLPVMAVLFLFEGLFELMTMLLLVNGRRVTHTISSRTISEDGSSSSITYNTTEERHPFFDASQGLVYNLQSATKVASPVVMILGAALSYWTYRAFPVSIRNAYGDIDDDHEAVRALAIDHALAGGYGGTDRDGPEALHGTMASPTMIPFSGKGQRLTAEG